MMRMNLMLGCLFCFFQAFSQEGNSLLWEISGNGLEKSSYLYGTMHVSKKIAFHLDDVFYEALEHSELVALESDPATWLQSDVEERNKQGFGYEAKGFYRDAFHFRPLETKEIARLLATDEGLINGILYRTNEYSQNFEEDTYLDMFIYRAGRKQGKAVIALEDLEESRTLVALAGRNAMKKKPDPWLQERMQREDLMSLMQDAYRSRNIRLLDSIDRAMYTDHYLRNMLYIRNRNMSEKLDSVVREKSVFAGIGAAHLPGESGVIALLRNKGYTVTPLTSGSGEVARNKKSRLESTYRSPKLETQLPEDGTFRIQLPERLYPVAEATHTTYLSPDLTNGGYFLAHRIPTFQLLPGRDQFDRAAIEALLFENIPGRITGQERIEKDGYPGLEVRNQLKNGDLQRYQVFLTPLEIFIFKLAGKGDYVNRYGDHIFTSLELTRQNGKPVFRSPFGEFQLKTPGLYRYPNASRPGNRHLEGIDTEGGYYFLRKVTLHDGDHLEEDAFELKQIQQRFYQDLGLEGSYGRVTGRSLQSQAQLPGDSRKLFLKTVIRGNDYYLLGYLGEKSRLGRDYLSSFRTGPREYPEEFTTISDTALYFKTVSPVAPRKFVEVKSRSSRQGKQPKSYQPYAKKTVYLYRNNEAIEVNMNKSHDLTMVPTLDSLWAQRRRHYTGDDLLVAEEHRTTGKNGAEELLLKLKDTASSRALLIKNVLKGGVLYELRTKVELEGKPSRFIDSFYTHFEPADTLIGRSPLEDKTGEFFRAVKRADSIALDGFKYLHFTEAHAPELMALLTEHQFSEAQRPIRIHLLNQLAKMKDPAVSNYMKSYYSLAFSDGSEQARIARAIARPADETAAEELLSLLRKDLPLAMNSYEIDAIFKPFHEQPGLATALFPELLQYFTVEEYKGAVIGLLAAAWKSDRLDREALAGYETALAADAALQLKRLLAYEAKPTRKVSKKQKRTSELLVAYLPLLFELQEYPGSRLFFERLPLVKDAAVRANFIALSAGSGMATTEMGLETLAADLNSRLLLYQVLAEAGKSDLIPEKFRSQRALAEAMVFEDRDFDPATDEITYVGECSLEEDGEEFSGYFFKARSSLGYYREPKMYLLAFKAGKLTADEPCYRGDGWRVLDTNTDAEVMALLKEQFHLSKRPRAVVYEAGKHNTFADFGF